MYKLVFSEDAKKDSPAPTGDFFVKTWQNAAVSLPLQRTTKRQHTMETNKQQGSLSLDLFFGLIKLGMTAYFIYHFIGWMTL